MSRVECDCLRVLRASAPLPLSASVISSRPWASALFVGSRLTIRVEGDDDVRLDEWLIALAEVELSWPGHFVASAEIIERSDCAAIIELLVIEA